MYKVLVLAVVAASFVFGQGEEYSPWYKQDVDIEYTPWWTNTITEYNYGDTTEWSYTSPDTFQLTISITGNHLTDPDIDTTPYTADGRYEAGAAVTITATQAAHHKLIPSATFPSSPTVVTLTSDSTIIIQSDTFPKYTRDTVITDEAHATVVVAPPTLSPVDSSVACTTSVSGVSEGYRCDSIVSVGATRHIVYYPITFIAYTMTENRIDSIFIGEAPATQFNLTTSYTGNGSVSPDGTTAQDSGAAVNISAIAGTNYHFVRWQVLSGTVGIADTLDATTTCTSHTDGSIRAVFGIDSFTVTTTINPTSSGTVNLTSNPTPYGQICTLTVAPTSGYKYLGISGDTLDTAATLRIMITSDKSYQFNFVNDSALILLIKTDNPGPTGDSSFMLPTNAYSTSWRWYSSDGFDTSTTATSHTHKFPQAGVYRIGIIQNGTNGFSDVFFYNSGDPEKVLRLERWGKNNCRNLSYSFQNTVNMKITARDTIVDGGIGDAQRCFYNSGIDTIPRMILNSCANMSLFASSCTNLVYIDTIHAPAAVYWNYAFEHCRKMRYFKGVRTNAGQDFAGMLRFCTTLDSAQFSMASALAMVEICRADSMMQKFKVSDALSGVIYSTSAFSSCTRYAPSRDYTWSSLVDGSFMYRGCAGLSNVNDSFPVAKNLMELAVECPNITSLRVYAPVCTSFWYVAHNCLDLDTIRIINDSCRDYRYAFSHTGNNGHTIDSFYISNHMKTMNRGLGCFEYNRLRTPAYSVVLDSLAAQNINTGIIFHGGYSQYLSSVADERLTLTSDRSWTITDGGMNIGTPEADSLRPNPWWRNDSSSVYGFNFTLSGKIRNLTTSTDVSQKYWSDDQIDYYTGNWPRGWNRLQITNSDSLRDTISQYIAIPRKVNP